MIELIIVIAVIAILMAIIVPSMNAYRTRANEAKARALFESISVALRNYKSDTGRYPYVDGSSDYYGELNRRLYIALSGDTNTNFVKESTDANAYLTFDTDALMEDSDGGRLPQIADPFGNAIGYWPLPDFHNRTSFNLWSRGKDGATASGVEMGNEENDINNWR